MGWGVWHLPESRLRILGDVEGKDVLELGCGAGRWSVALARRGARVVGLDLSPARLEQARRVMDLAGVEFPLLEASAEAVPLPSGSFDIVFCDWGAMTFADPYRTVPEVARLLRPGGLFAFSHASPIKALCQDRRTGRLTRRLRYDYFDLYRVPFLDGEEFQLPYGEWIRLFAANDLLVTDLFEPPPPRDDRTTYLTKEERAWARHWPNEVIWRVRKLPFEPPRPSRGRGTRPRRAVPSALRRRHSAGDGVRG
jgi:SAM-dependent methyltransferase